MTGSRPEPGSSDDDLDPTGVRALLANLPDPGPMPDDLVVRISQSLELEQQRRTSGAAGSAYPFGAGDHPTSPQVQEAPDGGVVSLAAERHRRRPGRTVLWLGGAAAVAMVATVSVNQLVGDGTGDAGVSAQVPASTDSAEGGADAGAEHGASEDSAADEGASDDGAASESSDNVAEPPPLTAGSDSADGEDSTADAGAAPQVRPLQGTIQLSASGWSEQVGSWIAATPTRGTSNWTTSEATDCVAAGEVDTGDATTLMLSDAVWDDQPATLLVAETGSGSTAWLLSTDCGELLAGPVAVD